MTAFATNTAAQSPQTPRLLAAIATWISVFANRNQSRPKPRASTYPSAEAATRLHLLNVGARLR